MRRSGLLVAFVLVMGQLYGQSADRIWPVHLGVDAVSGDSSITANWLPPEWRVGAAFSWGGESKLAFFLPKVVIVRRHEIARWRPYYGTSFGLYPLLIAGSGSGGLVIGTEWRALDVEASLNHWRTTRIPTGVDGVFRGPFAQNLITLRGGFRVGPVRLRAGGAWVLSERVPAAEERIGLMDIGVVKGRRYTLEIVWDGSLGGR